MIKYSRQRESIMNALMDRTDHPTAETIYNEIKEDYPKISLGTVYRNLTLLEELGKVQKISTEYGPDRFDYNVVPHCHFTCRECKGVSDLPFELHGEFLARVMESFDGRVEKCSILLSGVCPKCTRKLKQQEDNTN